MRVFSSKGRIKRLEFLFGSIGLFLLILMGIRIIGSIFYSDIILTALLLLMIGLWIYMQNCLIIKRFHDLDQPGINALYFLIPIYNIYLFIYLSVKKGKDGENRYDESMIVFKEAAFEKDTSRVFQFPSPQKNANSVIEKGYIDEGAVSKIRELKALIERRQMESRRVSDEAPCDS